MGDAGSGTLTQWRIARQMKKLYEKTPFNSVLVLGDNVYYSGNPKLFEKRIFKPYAGLFEAGVKFFPILGNHDMHDDHGERQLEYWGAPRYYKVGLGPSAEVDVFALDTNPMLPTYGGTYGKNPDEAGGLKEEQLAWLDKALGQSDASHKLVLGHYPLYASGTHGRRKNIVGPLRNMLEPVMTRHGVDAYLSGHVHHYERSRPIEGVTHFVSGSAGKVRHRWYPKKTYPRALYKIQPHFMVFEITDDGLKYQAVNARGKVIDEGVLN